MTSNIMLIQGVQHDSLSLHIYISIIYIYIHIYTYMYICIIHIHIYFICVYIYIAYICYVLSPFSRVQLCNPWMAARQAPLSIGFSRQEYWSGLPCPSPGDLSDPRNPPVLQADSLPLSHCGSVCVCVCVCV